MLELHQGGFTGKSQIKDCPPVAGGEFPPNFTARRNQAWGEDRHQRRKQFEMNVAMKSMENPTALRSDLEQIERDAQSDQHRMNRMENKTK